MPMTLVSTVTVGGSGAVGVDFGNIPQTGKDLLILASLRTTTSNSGNMRQVNLQIEGDTDQSYRNQILRASGSSVSASFTINIGSGLPLWWANDSGSTSTAFANCSAYISNYTRGAGVGISSESSAEANAAFSINELSAGRWQSIGLGTNRPVTYLYFFPTDGNFAAGSSFSLYIIS